MIDAIDTPDLTHVRRTKKLAAVLADWPAFKHFMQHERARNPLRDEEELTYMLNVEMLRDTPRRSMVKRLHGALTRVRQRREWADLESILDKNVSN